MDIAADRLAHAVQHGETVGVFGDYDVDGACSAALMVTLLRELGCEVLHHVPDRMMEGYGPNGPALHSLVLRGASLIVCVDCGTAAAEALGFIAGDADIVVLDHHKAEGPPPAIVATVNPNRLDCTSGLSLLCAAAVAFLTAVATVRTLRRQGFFNARKEPDLIGLLDLVALATVCDVMPLTGVNRALVCQGLKVMARRARPGVAALLDVAQVARPADRGHLRLRAGPAHQRGGADRRGRSRAAPAAVRGPGGGGVAGRHARCGQPPAPGGRGGDAGRCACVPPRRRQGRGMRRWWSAVRPGIRAWSASSPAGSRSASTARPASPASRTVWPRDRAVRWPGSIWVRR